MRNSVRWTSCKVGADDDSGGGGGDKDVHEGADRGDQCATLAPTSASSSVATSYTKPRTRREEHPPTPAATITRSVRGSYATAVGQMSRSASVAVHVDTLHRSAGRDGWSDVLGCASASVEVEVRAPMMMAAAAAAAVVVRLSVRHRNKKKKSVLARSSLVRELFFFF